MRIERVEEPTVFGFTWGIYGLPDDDPRRTYVEFTLEPTGTGTRLTVVESGFAQLPEDELPQGVRGQHRGLGERTGRAGRVPRCQRGLTSRPSRRQVFTALADPSRRGDPRGARGRRAGHGDGPCDSPAHHPSGDRQTPGAAGRSRAGRGRSAGSGVACATGCSSAPMQVAQQFLAALARDWDRQLDALQAHLNAAPADRPARRNDETSES